MPKELYAVDITEVMHAKLEEMAREHGTTKEEVLERALRLFRRLEKEAEPPGPDRP